MPADGRGEAVCYYHRMRVLVTSPAGQRSVTGNPIPTSRAGLGAIAAAGVAYYPRERGIEADEVGDTPAKGEPYGRLGDHDGTIARSSAAVTGELVARARKVRILGRAGVGVDVRLLDDDVRAEALEEVERAVKADFGRIVRMGP